QTKFGFERNRIGKTAFHTFIDRVTRRIDKIIQKLKDEDVPGIRNWKILLKHTKKPLIVALVRRCLQLKEILERLQLDSKQIRRIGNIVYFCEVDTSRRGSFLCCSHNIVSVKCV